MYTQSSVDALSLFVTPPFLHPVHVAPSVPELLIGVRPTSQVQSHRRRHSFAGHLCLIVHPSTLLSPPPSTLPPPMNGYLRSRGGILLLRRRRRGSAMLGHARPRSADHVTVYQETWREVGTKMVVASYERVDDFSRGSCFPIVRKKCRAAALSSRIQPAEGSAMIYDIKWIIPKLRNPTRLWKIASSITVAAVGIFSKIIIGRIVNALPPNEGHRKSVVGPHWPFNWLNKTTVYNKHIINRALDHRPKNVPLITVSNHFSCFDDPGVWATLDYRHLLDRRKIRWSLTAHDICFTNTWHSYLFMLGKCIPVIRGAGVYQEAMDFCIEKLASGDWIHVFPEGKVNMNKECIRFKWGVGRLIWESPVTPLVIPICHLGMDEVLPNEPPYRLKLQKKVTMNYGNPIDFNQLIQELRASKASDMEARKAITDRLQEEILRLKTATEELHQKL